MEVPKSESKGNQTEPRSASDERRFWGLHKKVASFLEPRNARPNAERVSESRALDAASLETVATSEIGNLSDLEGVELVNACFIQFLSRKPNEVDLQHFSALLAAGASREELVGTIAGTDEARARRALLTDAPVALQRECSVLPDCGSSSEMRNDDDLLELSGSDLIRTCFARFLGRSPSENDLSHFIASLAGGLSPAELIRAIKESDEARIRRSLQPTAAAAAKPAADPEGGADQVCATSLIEACYRIFLGRKPDRADVRHFSGLLDAGVGVVEIVRMIEESEEATNRRSGPNGSVPMVIMRPDVSRLKPHEAGKVEGIGRSSSGADPYDTLWIDMTTSFEWPMGVVGIVRAELELACGLKKLDPRVRFSMQAGGGFGEIKESELQWLLEADNVTDAYLSFFGRSKSGPTRPRSIHVDIPLNASGFFHPYGDKDLILSVGWMDSQKERYFSRLKSHAPSVKLCYLIYDLIMALESTSHFYAKDHRDKFIRYLRWISKNADFLLFGGETAKADTQKYFQNQGWRLPPGLSVKFGTDIVKSVDPEEAPRLLREVGVEGPFMLNVGSLEPRKNHDTLYRAYLLALELCPDNLPQLVICGKPMAGVAQLVDSLKRNPLLENKVILATPSDAQLAALYKNCLFTLLPSVYEGWSLTLPESLGQGKFCLSCDTPPLREIGQDLVDYVQPYDVRGWAEQIVRYSTDPELLRERERKIAAEWPTTLWFDTAKMVSDALDALARSVPERATAAAVGASDAYKQPTIWMDLTLTYLLWPGTVTGVIRTELTLAHYLKKLAPDTRFFAHSEGCFFQIEDERLEWLFSATELSAAYDEFHKFWKPLEEQGTSFRDPLRLRGSSALGEQILTELPANSIVFFAAIDMDGTGEVHRTRDVLDLIPRSSGTMTAQLIYDFTPIIVPHLHAEWTCIGYAPFIDFVSDNFDFLIYGGRTAQRDAHRRQAGRNLVLPPNNFLEFGSDLSLEAAPEEMSPAEEQETLRWLGVTQDFIITVGTIEPRKNHEMLYKAFLHILERNCLDKPLQLIFVGKLGWKYEDFMEVFWSDPRIKGRVLHITPSDKQLRVLYKHCKFTLLPSFYEGWSLTLPESLTYGKFCLTSDVDPLREIGGELVEYIHPLDTYKWAERIEFYANHPEEVEKREAAIKERWHPTTWLDATKALLDMLSGAHRNFVGRTNERSV